MGAAVALDAAPIQVTPGQETRTEVRVRNTGQVVDHFDLDVLGDAKSWITVEPASVNLLPSAEETVTLVLKPPKTSAVLAGETRFALRMFSHEDTEGSVIHEATALVVPFVEIAADLVPRTSRGSRRGRHELAVDNTGNRPAMVEIRPNDPDQQLEFRLEQSALDTEPGTAAFVGVQARPVKRFLRGPNKTLPFQVLVTPQDAPEGVEPITVNGSMLQEALLPKWLMVVAVAVAAGILAMVIFWYTLVKPEVQTTARQAARQETAQLAQAVNAAQAKAAEASQDAAEAKEAAGVGENGAGGGGAGGGGAGGGQDGSATASAAPRGPADAAFAPSATDLRITTAAAPGNPGEFKTFNNDPPEGKQYWISDLVLQNPRGDSGILQVRRGDDVLFEVGLDNFRDLDYHFIQPVRFTHEQAVVVAVDCRNPADACTPSVYFTGQVLPEPSASPTPTPTPTR